jgi:acetyltransferase-like isoleucine patch superfamily enzyme
MDCKELIVDSRIPDPEAYKVGTKNAQLLFKLNHTMPMTEEYSKVVQELFDGRIGEGTMLTAPLQGVCFEHVKIGKNVYIGSNLLLMARGGIEIEDGAWIAANVQLLSNNHDLYDRAVLQCKPVLIKEDAWIGAGATILAGVCVGRHAVVGAGSVVTRDVPDYAVVVGSPARVVRMLDKEKFGE